MVLGNLTFNWEQQIAEVVSKHRNDLNYTIKSTSELIKTRFFHCIMKGRLNYFLGAIDKVPNYIRRGTKILKIENTPSNSCRPNRRCQFQWKWVCYKVHTKSAASSSMAILFDKNLHRPWTYDSKHRSKISNRQGN